MLVAGGVTGSSAQAQHVAIDDRNAHPRPQPPQAHRADPRCENDLIKNSCSIVVKGAQDYNDKFIEFAQANTHAAFDFVQKLSGVTSPSAFVELSTEHARKQLDTLTEQTQQLAAIAQKVTLATAEPFKAGVAKAFNHAA